MKNLVYKIIEVTLYENSTEVMQANANNANEQVAPDICADRLVP